MRIGRIEVQIIPRKQNGHEKHQNAQRTCHRKYGTMIIMESDICEESEIKSVVKTYLFDAKSFPLERVTKVICDS